MWASWPNYKTSQSSWWTRAEAVRKYLMLRWPFVFLRLLKTLQSVCKQHEVYIKEQHVTYGAPYLDWLYSYCACGSSESYSTDADFNQDTCWFLKGIRLVTSGWTSPVTYSESTGNVEFHSTAPLSSDTDSQTPRWLPGWSECHPADTFYKSVILLSLRKSPQIHSFVMVNSRSRGHLDNHHETD